MAPARPVPVTVIVAVRNGERFLADALASVAAQSTPPAEVLVVDGGSTDGTAQVAEAAGARVVAQIGLGLAGARNQGIAAARNPLISFLDHDDRWEPAKLQRQTELMRSRPQLGYTLTGMRFELHLDTPCPAHLDPDTLAAPRVAGTPGALMARRSLFDRLGGFDPTLTIGCDADWFTRARDAGVPTAHLADPLLVKRLHSHNLSSDTATNRREMFDVARRSIARRHARSR